MRTIKVSSEQVYNSFLDLDSAKEWMQGLVRIERLDDGPIQEGSQWKETRKVFGTKSTEHFEVVELVESKIAKFRCDGEKGTTGKGLYTFTYSFEEKKDNVTEVMLHGSVEGLYGFSKLFGKMMASMFKKACAKDLDNLKKRLEAK